jgi:hypothetical protein
MPYQVEVGGKADAQLAGLDAAMGAGVERKIQWLAENAAGMVHRRLVGLPRKMMLVTGLQKPSCSRTVCPAKQSPEQATAYEQATQTAR